MFKLFLKKKEKKKRNVIFAFFCVVVIILAAFFVLYTMNGVKPDTRTQIQPNVPNESTGAKKVIVSPDIKEEAEGVVKQEQPESVELDTEEFDILEQTCPPREQAMVNGTISGYDKNYVYISGSKNGEEKIRLNSKTEYVRMLTNDKYELISREKTSIEKINKGQSVSVVAIKDSGGEMHAVVVKEIVVQ